jgi:hypothetical protein
MTFSESARRQFILRPPPAVACWAHARRKFFDAKDTTPASRRDARVRPPVYAVEDGAKTLDHDQRCGLRQKKSVPILAAIKAWLDAEQQLVLPRSPMAVAIMYTLNQWAALNCYVEQGFLNIDNSAAERAEVRGDRSKELALRQPVLAREAHIAQRLLDPLFDDVGRFCPASFISRPLSPRRIECPGYLGSV